MIMTNCIETAGLVKRYPLFTLGPVDLTVLALSFLCSCLIYRKKEI